KAPLPAIARLLDGRYFVVARFDPGKGDGVQAGAPRLLVQHAGQPPEIISVEDFIAQSTGELMFFMSKATFSGPLARFDFTWFIPVIIKYRRLLGEILLISLCLQLIGLVTPLFFQVVMDKVLVNHAMKTLNVIAIGLVTATLFEAALTGIRTWVFAHTSSKIDVELGARIFRHLLGLPLSYFQSRRVGDSVARIRELENIRSFLTSNALTVVLDIAFSFVFLGVMFWYSKALTFIVLASIPCYVALSVVFTPMIRSRLDEKFNRSAENQSFLVETISGVDTVKAMAVEPRWTHKWDQQLAAYVTAGLSVTNVATIAGGGVTLVSKLVTAAILWKGAGLVLNNELTVGALIAFNMLAGQVSSPILRLAQLWNDFQQVGISMSRLGDILNAPTEVSTQRTRLPKIAGAIEFDQVSFRYRPDTADVIRQVDLKIVPGETIGIVGRSGSGKSTLTRLVQRLFVPDRGRVLVDGHDLAVVDAVSLRQQIGVVLQENTLFNRSIRANIALASPALPLEAVIEAARLAGAHDFICELPEGYDTVVGEHGTGLSGGQRQRIAIARALITNPRVLIFDEATSALDYESEKIIQDNMRQICAGRTVLIIAHRLSAVRDAHRILVMERGQVVEEGTHAELLQVRDGIYAHLYKLQQGMQSEVCAV
ncbi:MAG TPA: type I secretion system permease/ATPase, partial [Chlorobaculum sp.]|nr:type I secretion system permease/ATPase [Chlorobaculum sp.]